MRAAALGLALVVLTAGLAGCLSSEDDEAIDEQSRPTDNGTTEPGQDAAPSDNDTAEPVDEGPEIETAWFNGSVRGHSAPVLGPFCVETCDNQQEFAVPENTSALQVELAWTAEASMLLDVDVPFEHCEASMMEDCPPEHASGDAGHITVRVTREADIVEGDWQASAWAEDSLPEVVEFTMAISLTEDELPSDHALLPAEDA